MSDPDRAAPFTGRDLIVHVEYDSEKKTTKISKPEKLYDEAYSVSGDVVHVHRLEGENGFPVLMRLTSNLWIKAIGFAERGCVPKCTVKGCCGGCFDLLADIGSPPQLETPLIRNHGHAPKRGYHFKVWLEDEGGIEHEIPVDPQIYNEGDTEPPPLLRLLRRLLRWLGLA
jgi:hypothetical protein